MASRLRWAVQRTNDVAGITSDRKIAHDGSADRQSRKQLVQIAASYSSKLTIETDNLAKLQQSSLANRRILRQVEQTAAAFAENGFGHHQFVHHLRRDHLEAASASLAVDGGKRVFAA